MKTIFDIGMYDASDTLYYLEEGHRVVAIEANPALVRRAKERLRQHVEAGRLHIINAAIGAESGTVELIISGEDIGSSSIAAERVASRNPVGSYSVRTISIQELFAQYGVPYYLKIDIEGADRFCVLGLRSDTRPQFLSFEIGEDVEELVTHASAIGYGRFKIINQCNFLELADQHRLYERAARRVFRLMGYADPRQIKRAGRFFNVGHSSGPAPWCSAGSWYSAQSVLSRWLVAKNSNQLSGWYDMHAA